MLKRTATVAAAFITTGGAVVTAKGGVDTPTVKCTGADNSPVVAVAVVVATTSKRTGF